MIKRLFQLVAFILLLLILFSVWFFQCRSNPAYVAVEPIETKEFSDHAVAPNELKNAYFGDLHIHTSWSFDAFIYNVRTTPDDAYRYGKGEAIPHVSGTPIQINRPLDFMAVTDHSEYMGIMTQMSDSSNDLAHLKIAKRINNPDPNISKKAFGNIGFSLATNWPYKELIQREIIQNTWNRIVEIADDHYQPGTFTTFPGYEWTSSPAVIFSRPQYARNLHRNIIFKGGKVTGIPFSSFDSQHPEELWKWMENQRDQDIDVIAIPHNANISDGRMYALTMQNGDPITREYAAKRMRNEPVNEVLQIKGQSMAHPELSPNDEFAEFEIYQHSFGRSEPRKQSQVKGSYVREALKDGLAITQRAGENPFKFGFIGSSDGHNGASNIDENNQIGKSGVQDYTAHLRMADSPNSAIQRQNSVAGLAGVWATKNTREAIFDALERKEVFGTSGPRIKVRFFAGWELDTLDLEDTDWPLQAYKMGVPMGGDLPTSSQQEDKFPTFVIQAIKDEEGANLERIQVIKAWVDQEGVTHEKIFNVAWSDNRKIDESGNLTAVGNTVDLSNATYKNSIGAMTLQTIWNDTEFEKNRHSVYYLRVLEIPTPRWTTYDAVKLGITLPENVQPVIQERAWSSPIWYSPE